MARLENQAAYIIVELSHSCECVSILSALQAVETFNQSQEMSDSEDDTGQFISDESVKLDQKSENHPNFEILLTRKFEVSELCEIFFNRWVKYLYILLVAMAGFLACWSFSTVAASAWASNIPLNFGTLRQCGPQAFHHRVLPIGEGLDGCLNSYYFCLLLFAVIVIPLSLLELKEQAIVQMCLGLLRFLTVATIIIYCIVKLIQVGDICLPLGNETLSNTSATLNATTDYSNISHTVEPLKLRDIVIKFNWEGWLTSVPVFTYAFIVHQGIPSLTHPIKQKQYFRLLIGIVFASIAFSYFSLGIVAPLWFRASIQETVTLNWVSSVLSFTGFLPLFLVCLVLRTSVANVLWPCGQSHVPDLCVCPSLAHYLSSSLTFLHR